MLIERAAGVAGDTGEYDGVFDDDVFVLESKLNRSKLKLSLKRLIGGLEREGMMKVGVLAMTTSPSRSLVKLRSVMADVDLRSDSTKGMA